MRVVGTVNGDGSPHMVPVGYGFDGERFLVPTGSTTRKARNVETDPRVRVLVMARRLPPQSTMGGWPRTGQPISFEGRKPRSSTRRLSPGTSPRKEGGEFANTFLPVMDATIVVTPNRWQTKDVPGMKDTMIEHGYTEEGAARWYVPR